MEFKKLFLNNSNFDRLCFLLLQIFVIFQVNFGNIKLRKTVYGHIIEQLKIKTG